MKKGMRAPVLLLFSIALWPDLAMAEPTLTNPGLAQPQPATPPGSYHAIPPLPFSESPMPTLPPPQKMGAEEPLPPGAGHVMQRPGYDALMHDDGRLIFDARFLRSGLSSDPMTGPRHTATFDVGDILTSLFADGPGFDPYVSDKLELMHDTFAQRVELRQAHKELVMDRALSALPAYLNAVWNEPSWDIATKRRILFALWDECAEGGDELVRSGGEEARQTITSFIRSTLPAGSPEAYTPEELSAFNQVRGSQIFFTPHQEPSSSAIIRSEAPGSF